MHALFESSRFAGRERSSRFVAGWLRVFGPLMAEQKIGMVNLAAAFPELDAAARTKILSGVWENLGRTTVEYAFLQDIVDAFEVTCPVGGMVEHIGVEHAHALRDGAKPGIIFGAHIGNWELTAAIGAKIGLPVTTLYQPPTNPYIAAEIERRRSHFIDKLVIAKSRRCPSDRCRAPFRQEYRHSR